MSLHKTESPSHVTHHRKPRPLTMEQLDRREVMAASLEIPQIVDQMGPIAVHQTLERDVCEAQLSTSKLHRPVQGAETRIEQPGFRDGPLTVVAPSVSIGASAASSNAPALTQVSIAPDGTTWGIDANQHVFRFEGNIWSQVMAAKTGQPAPTLKQISVGSRNDIYGINAANQVFRWDGTQFNQLNAGLVQVSVAPDGTAWGINSNQHVFRFQGNVWSQVLAPNPAQPAPTLKQISVGAGNMIWGVNASNQVFRWDGSQFTAVQPSSATLVQVSVAADGTAWGLNSNQHVFRYEGNTWSQVVSPISGQPAPTLKQISVASKNVVWGVNAASQVFRWDGSQFTGDTMLKPEVLRIQGTRGNDHIIIREVRGWITIRGAQIVGRDNLREVETRLISRIEVLGGDGNDTIDLKGLSVGSEIHAGAGNDTVYGTKVDDLIYGEEGWDYLYGLDGDDQLFGGQYKDFLHGGAGNDGIFGGDANYNDTVFGGTGNDRFLLQPGDAIRDQTGSDARIDFFDSPSTSIATEGTQKKWADREIEVIDNAFSLLQSRTGNTRLLKDTTYSAPLKFYKYIPTNPDEGGYNFTDGSRREIVIRDWDQNDADQNTQTLKTVIHEIGHNWDEPAELNRVKRGFGDTIVLFRDLSSWDKVDGKWESGNSTLIGPGFARSYGATNPMDDWSTCWETQFGEKYLGENRYDSVIGDAGNFDRKMSLIDSFFKDIGRLA